VSRRTVFFVSDQTGVTAETLGHSLMTQFEGLEFRPVTLPFVSTLDKAREVVRRIDRAAQEEGLRPIVFSTLVQDELREVLLTANALFLDLFSTFVGPLERELNTRSTHRAGRAHGIADLAAYTTRINATNFALANDDGTGGDFSENIQSASVTLDRSRAKELWILDRQKVMNHEHGLDVGPFLQPAEIVRSR